MIDVVKLGMNYYSENLERKDKNSGLFEVSLIENEIEKIWCNDAEKCDVEIIINGALSDNEQFEFKSKDSKKIFILSDLQCMRACKSIIDRCDILLHQVPSDGFEFNSVDKHVEQRYGYIPELFFVERKRAPYKHDLVLFGGNDFERADDVSKFIMSEAYGELTINPYFLLLYKSYSHYIDTRLDYSEYIKLLSLMKYSLIIARKEYEEIGWVTSRIVEAYDNFVLPFVGENYDKYSHFCVSSFKVHDYDEIKHKVENNIYEYQKVQWMIEHHRDKIAKDRVKFKELIANV